MTKYNRPNGKLFGSSASNIGVFGSGQTGETPTTSTDPNAINTLNTHWEDGWNGAVVSQAPYTAPFIEDMNAVNYVNSYNSAYLLQRGIPEYDSNEEYQTDSVCTYNGEIWICLQDSTTNVTPSEGAYWHLQGEVPVMQDNEILVGDTGNGATVTDTLNQGDIVASTSGLDIKAGVVTNTHISSQAGDKIAESKVNLAYSTSTLNTNIGNVSNALTTHTSDTANPHQTTVSNLDDTNISGSLAGDDTLVYDGINSEWVNIPNTVSNLKDTTVTTPTNNDVLWYYNGVWVNTPNVNNHMTSKLNPHETEFSNLHDATISTPSDQDTVVYDNVSSKWINQPNTVENLKNATVTTPSNDDVLVYNNGNWENSDSLANHLSDSNNPHTTTVDNLDDTTITSVQDGDTLVYDGNSSKWINGTPSGGAVSTLSDVTLTTPQQNDVLLYDSGSSKWINSDILEVREIANVNNATTNVTLTASDKRHQIFTNTNGFNITLPSTDIVAGDKFVFDWTSRSSITGYSTPFSIYASDNTLIGNAYIGYFRYEFIAKVNAPSTYSDWTFKYTDLMEYVWKSGVDYQRNVGVTANNLYTARSDALISLCPAIWELGLRSAYCSMTPANGYKNGSRAVCLINGVETVLTYADSSIVGSYGERNYTSGRSEGSILTLISSNGNLGHASPYSVVGMFHQIYQNQFTIYIRNNITASANSTIWYQNFLWARLVAPLTSGVLF